MDTKSIFEKKIISGARYSSANHSKQCLLCAAWEHVGQHVRRQSWGREEEGRRPHHADQAQPPPKPPRSKVSGGIRFNKVPPLVWEATDWTKTVDLGNLKCWEPPVTTKYSDEELYSAIQSPMNFEKFPVHSQSVERCVKLVTEASSSVYGQESRHGFILNKVASRKSRKSFSSKKYYEIKD